MRSFIFSWFSISNNVLGCLHLIRTHEKKRIMLVSLQDLNEGIEEPREVLLKKLSVSLLSIAKRHEGYLTLWNICCDLNDAVLLRNIMVSKLICDGILFLFGHLTFYFKKGRHQNGIVQACLDVCGKSGSNAIITNYILPFTFTFLAQHNISQKGIWLLAL